MSDLPRIITIETWRLLDVIDTALRQENGVSEQVYDDMFLMIDSVSSELWHQIARNVDATDGRFYLCDGVPSLRTLVPTPDVKH